MNCEPCERRGRVAEATREINGEWFCEICFRGGDGRMKTKRPNKPPVSLPRAVILRELRKGWRQYEVAKRLGVSRSTVSKVSRRARG